MSKLQRMRILTSLWVFDEREACIRDETLEVWRNRVIKKWLFVSPCAWGIRTDTHPQPIRVSRLFINHTLASLATYKEPSALPDTTRDDDAEWKSKVCCDFKGTFTVLCLTWGKHVPRWSQPKALVEHWMRPFLQEAFMSNGLGTQGLSQRRVIVKDDIWDYKSTSLAVTSETVWNHKSNILHEGIHQGPDSHSTVTQCWRDPARDCELS